jgi:integrase
LNTAVADDAIGRNPACVGPVSAQAGTTPGRPCRRGARCSRDAGGLETAVLLAVWAHLRVGEFLGMQRGNIDLDAGTLAGQRQVVDVRGPIVVEPKMGCRRVAVFAWLTARVRVAARCGIAALSRYR